MTCDNVPELAIADSQCFHPPIVGTKLKFLLQKTIGNVHYRAEFIALNSKLGSVTQFSVVGNFTIAPVLKVGQEEAFSIFLLSHSHCLLSFSSS